MIPSQHCRTSRLHRWLMIITALLYVFTTGCAEKTPPPDPNTVYGKYGQASYTFLRWDQGLEVLLWHDLPYSTFCQASDRNNSPVFTLQCVAGTIDDGIAWIVRTRNGVKGQLKIANRTYKLTNGTLFLIRTTTDGYHIFQEERAFESLLLERESVIDFAESDPDIRRFLDEVSSD